MTIQEFYAMTGGDYGDVLSSLGKEERIYKYLSRFPETDIIGNISTALEKEDYETAFREAHNLKGMSLNVGIVSLQKVAIDLTESLRNGPTGDVKGFFALTVSEYERCCDLIKQIEKA